jgi:hypothetical protein
MSVHIPMPSGMSQKLSLARVAETTPDALCFGAKSGEGGTPVGLLTKPPCNLAGR